MQIIDISNEIKAEVFEYYGHQNSKKYIIHYCNYIDVNLGFVELDVPGGKYCYYPAQNIILTPETMQLIIDFLNKLNKELEK